MAAPKTSVCARRVSSGRGRADLTSRSGLVTHFAAHLGEEPPFGGREAVDAARRDLVEHAVDLGLRGIARGAGRLPSVAPPPPPPPPPRPPRSPAPRARDARARSARRRAARAAPPGRGASLRS